ncbi:MAG: succinate dehydrogenase hydrophobic membrane anchor subunit [Ardenticatenales bacterium]|nr:succinate dehydrogenase hydrophobic membrane anchor subunit [Ardenticatenales bacterium]
MSIYRTPRAERVRAQGNFELYAWFFMRVSGLVLLFIAVFHLLYMHLYARVETIDYAWVVQRWSNPGWRLYDWLLLTFALSHGTNGVRTVIDDYVPRGLGNVVCKWTAFGLALFFFVMGTQVILTTKVPAAALALLRLVA